MSHCKQLHRYLEPSVKVYCCHQWSNKDHEPCRGCDRSLPKISIYLGSTVMETMALVLCCRLAVWSESLLKLV